MRLRIFEDFVSLNEAVTPAGIQAYYSEVCRREGIAEIPLKFRSVAYGGAATTYDTVTMKPLYISFDVSRMTDAEQAVLHEITHQMKLVQEKDPYLGKKDQSSKFRKLENSLVDKYMYSDISRLIWK